MPRTKGVVESDPSRYNKQAVLTSRTYGSPFVNRGQNDNIILDLGQRLPLLSFFLTSIISALTFLLVYFVFIPFNSARIIVLGIIGYLFPNKPAVTSKKPFDIGPLRERTLPRHLDVVLPLQGQAPGSYSLILGSLHGFRRVPTPKPTPLVGKPNSMPTPIGEYPDLVTRGDPTSPLALDEVRSEPSKIGRLGDASASITVSAADVVLAARSRRAEVVGSGQDIGDPGKVFQETIEVGNETNLPIIPSTERSPPKHNFHIKASTCSSKSVGYDRTELSEKWTCSIPLGVLLSRFRTRGMRLGYSNKLSMTAQRATKLPRTSRGLWGRGRFDLTTFLVEPMICSPVVRRYRGRIRFILQLASPFFNTLGWESGPSNYFRFGCSDGSGQAPPSLGHNPFSWGRGDFWLGNDPNIEIPTANSLGLKEGLGTDEIPELPPEAAVASTLYGSSSFPIPEPISFPPTPPPPLDLNALYQRSHAEPHLEGVGCGDSLYGYHAYTMPTQHNSMENHGTSKQGHEPVSHSSLLAPSRKPLPEPGVSNQPELRSYATVRPTGSPSIGLPFQDIIVYSAHNNHRPHLSEANATANNDTGAADTIPEQLSFSFNPPTQPDLDPPNQQSFSRGFIAGFKFAMKLTATCTQANASPVRAESSKSPAHADRRVQPPSPPIAPALGLDKANSLSSGRGSPAAAPSVFGEVGLQLYAPFAFAPPDPTPSPDPASISGTLPGAGTNPAVGSRESRQELEPNAQNVGQDHNPPTSQAIQSIVLEDAPSTSTHQAPVSPPNPMYSMNNVLRPTPGPPSNSQGKARKSKKCPECDCAFRRPGELRDHIASRHRGEKQHTCSFDGCDKTYGTRSNLAKHVKQKHTASAPTMPEHHIG